MFKGLRRSGTLIPEIESARSENTNLMGLLTSGRSASGSNTKHSEAITQRDYGSGTPKERKYSRVCCCCCMPKAKTATLLIAIFTVLASGVDAGYVLFTNQLNLGADFWATSRLISDVTWIVCSLSGIAAVYSESPDWLRPFYIMMVISTGLLILGLFGSVLTFLTIQIVDIQIAAMVYFLIFLLVIPFEVYFTLIVRCCYRNFKENNACDKADYEMQTF
uniref:PGG domain-containing protein n=1 Tax=Steinernema glaseri TaxID=37863 RepID=A0A1I7YG79_9BILA